MHSSMSQSQLIEEDIALLFLAVGELEQYLLSAELYWPLFNNPRMKLVNPRSRLTPGNLLLSMQRLSVISFDPQKQDQIQEKIAKFSGIREKWKSHWRLKAQQEYAARLDLWQAYLLDLFEDRGSFAFNFTYAVRWRTILQLLRQEGIEIQEALLVSLAAMDENLKALTQPADFVWGEEIQPAFEPAQYWFLYRKVLE